LDSLKLIPITDQHPDEMVTVDNVKKYLIGMVGEEISRKDEYVTGNMIITDKNMVETIQARKDFGLTTELSGGYTCFVTKEDGTHPKDGYYNAKQTNIKYNHLSIVDMARAGENVRIMDSKDKDPEKDSDTNGLNGKGNATKEDNMPDLVKFIRRETKMDSFTVDQISCEIPEESFEAVELLSNKLDEAISLIGELTKKRDELQGKIDQSEEVVEGLRNDIASLKDPNSAEIQAMVKARKEVEDVAGTLKVETDGKDIQDIKVECIKSVSSNFDSEGKSVDYINARFDSVIEILEARKQADDDNKNGQLNKDSKDGEKKLSPKEKFLLRDAENRK
jgi:hypothetical protein